MRPTTWVLFGLIVGGAIACLYLILISPPDPGSLDLAAVKRIHRLCGARDDCEITLRDVFPGDWDTFYQFDYTVSQHDVSQTLNTSSVRVADLKELYVFAKNGHVLKESYGDTGEGQPLAGEIEFSGQVDAHAGDWRRYVPTDRFKVKSCSTLEGGKLFGPSGGTSYLLVLTPLRASYKRQCQMPIG